MKFRTQFNHKNLPTHYEVNLLPSLTIPDQSMTMDEILTRYAHGLPFQAGKVPVFEEEQDMHDFSYVNPATLDLAELYEIRQDNDRTLADLREELNKKALELKERKQKEARERLKADLKKELDSESAKPNNTP